MAFHVSVLVSLVTLSVNLLCKMSLFASTFFVIISSEFMVVYHLPKKSGNFGWNVNGKINFVSPNGNFLGKTGFLER